jgi:hypothetical protein
MWFAVVWPTTAPHGRALWVRPLSAPAPHSLTSTTARDAALRRVHPVSHRRDDRAPTPPVRLSAQTLTHRTDDRHRAHGGIAHPPGRVHPQHGRVLQVRAARALARASAHCGRAARSSRSCSSRARRRSCSRCGRSRTSCATTSRSTARTPPRAPPARATPPSASARSGSSRSRSSCASRRASPASADTRQRDGRARLRPWLPPPWSTRERRARGDPHGLHQCVPPREDVCARADARPVPLAVVLIFGSKMDILLALVCWRRAPAPRAVRRMSIEKLPLPRAGRDAV